MNKNMSKPRPALVEAPSPVFPPHRSQDRKLNLVSPDLSRSYQLHVRHAVLASATGVISLCMLFTLEHNASQANFRIIAAASNIEPERRNSRLTCKPGTHTCSCPAAALENGAGPLRSRSTCRLQLLRQWQQWRPGTCSVRRTARATRFTRTDPPLVRSEQSCIPPLMPRRHHVLSLDAKMARTT
jgi:hypothetical protein